MGINNFLKLNQLCTKITDGSHFSPKGIQAGYPMLSVKDMLNNGFSYENCKFISSADYAELVKSDCKPKKNDILIAKDGSYLKHVFVIKDEIEQAILSSIGILRPDLQKVYPEYLKYYLQTSSVKETVTKKYVSGSALPRIILKNFGEIDIIFKDLNTQKKLAKVLSTLDSKIELNNRINAELEAMAKTIYDYWFVQFDFPDQNSKPYKASGGKMVWNEELKREIPDIKEWQVGSLLEIANFDNGLACQKFRPIDSNYLRVIKIKEMNEGFSENSELVRSNIPSKAIIENGDVLFSWSASLDVKIWTGGSGALNQHIFKVSSDKFPRSFYFFQLINYLSHFKMMAENRKTTMGHITQEHLKQSRIIIPPKEITLSLEKVLNPIIEKKIKCDIENQKLTELRDWLLPMLMNGQVKVKEAEKYIQTQNNLSMAAEPEVGYGE